MSGFIKDKRLILGFALLIGLAVSFWAGSRVPQLNEKASMGAEVNITTLGFDTVFEVKPDDAIYLKIIYTTVNWVDTNKKGMTFGVLFASAIMMLFSLFKRRSFNNSFANSALGIAIGTPLGVCVNCAAPIAAGMAAAGTRLETTLATMISSPTLNIIVLTILFSLFPFYMVLIKIGFTLFFIIILIPLITQFFLKKEVKDSIDKGEACSIGSSACDISPLDLFSAEAANSWWLSSKWIFVNYFKNFWFVFKTTVPLMAVAGLLGSIVIIFLPWDSLAELVPGDNIIMILIGMGVVACIGIFLPVPISFDVIMSAILMAAGMPIKYVMVLLFTLGIYSVYSFFIVQQSVSRKAAIILPAVLVVLGVLSGLTAHYFWKVEFEEHKQLALNHFKASTNKPQPTHKINDENNIGQVIVEPLNTIYSHVAVTGDKSIKVESVKFSPSTVLSNYAFKKIEGRELGLGEPFKFSFYKTMMPISLGYGRTISTGDVNNDGWVDVLFVAEDGLALYVNQGSRRFQKQRINLPKFNNSFIGAAALVDLNNDGLLDIYFTTLTDGDHVIYNKLGGFTENNLVDIPVYDNNVMTTAIGFADLDKDGDLDAVKGHWSIGWGKGNWLGSEKSRNFILRNNSGKFSLERFGNVPGVPIGILISDYNNDGELDLIIGNDFDTPDLFYIGDSKGGFSEVDNSMGLIPHSTHDTMGITTADINNDLIPEIFMGDVSRYPDNDKNFYNLKIEDVCRDIKNLKDKSSCQEYANVHRTYFEIIQRNDVTQCASFKNKQNRDDCIVFFFIRNPAKHGGEEICSLIPNKWKDISALCKANLNSAYIQKKDVLDNSIPQIPYKNILLQRDKNNVFVDRAEEMGIQLGGFTWNAKFIDIDNDEWQDLYVANGWMEIRKRRESNYFYHNEQGKTFVNKTNEYGLSNYFATSAYSYADIDNDGDQDIITIPMNAPIQVFVNNNDKGESISVELYDKKGNSHGIGSKIIIYYGENNQRNQMRELRASGGILSYDASIAHFGLGKYTKVNKIKILWSTGEESVIKGKFISGARYKITRNNMPHIALIIKR